MSLNNEFDVQNVFHLVGEQTLPVYLAAQQFRPETKHYLLTSRSQKTELTVRRLQSALNRQGLKSEVIYLGDESIAVSYQNLLPTLQTVIGKYGGSGNAVFEITGGTKLMAFAGLVTANQENMKAFYVDTRGKKLFCLNRQNEEYDLKCEMSIREFVTLNGMTTTPGKNLNVTREFVRYMNEHCHVFQSSQAQFAKSIDKKTANPKNLFQSAYSTMVNRHQDKIPEWGGQWEAFLKANGIENDWQAQARFLSGGWYEHYVYEELREEAGIREIQLNTTVSFQQNNKSAQEFDVVYTDGCSLVIVECKAGRVIQDYVQKLENLRNDYSGALGKCALVSLGRSTEFVNVAERIRNNRAIAGFFGKEGLQMLKNHLFDFVTGTVYEQHGQKKSARRTP